MAMTDAREHQSSRTVPVALWLGYGGLIPFVVGAALLWLIQPQWRSFTATALSAYAAVIVSFLGGILWGIGFRDGTPRLFLWGVVPSLVAATALMLSPGHGLLVHGLMLLSCYAVDRRVYPAHGLRAWLSLRWRLSLVAAIACFVAAAAP
jgi:hypothetical protein